MQDQFASEMTDEQRAVYDAILYGPRARGPQHFELRNLDGTLRGPFGLMVEYPEVGGPLQALGAAVRFRTTLSDREREIAVLTVAYVTGSQFEQAAHEAIGRTCGLGEDIFDALRNNETATLTSREQVVVELTRHLVSSPQPADHAITSAATRLDRQTIYEVAVITGYYRLLAHTMSLLGQSPRSDHEHGPENGRAQPAP
ncbi:carboxymuconolactone decarboxylase family protein [Prauserella aidingensis]|uniref:carboxymuconolactone decarboxylase family protein n=1 Tax=Prauserella aidingensis TaxID=387890 RepID=UPI0020A38B62|nr:carboxymuconolactone decarboxylase family protein [Prauserella aidingensis]